MGVWESKICCWSGDGPPICVFVLLVISWLGFCGAAVCAIAEFDQLVEDSLSSLCIATVAIFMFLCRLFLLCIFHF